jgi:hypothetical protein
MKPLGLFIALFACPANAAELQFCWIGEAGYTLAGRMVFPDHLDEADRITEADVTAFDIVGYHENRFVGQWSLTDLRPDTSWNLNFLPREMRFATGGTSSGDEGQQWNADGSATDCGNPGFGFNSGASAQDICLDGDFIVESGIDPTAPLMAQPTSAPLDCPQPAQISLLRLPDQTSTP